MRKINKCKLCEREFKSSPDVLTAISQNKKLKFPVSDYFNLCSTHRKYKKNCPVCGVEHYNQGIACSHEHAYQLKQQTWISSTGTPHNFCKNSSSRLEWEQRLLVEEGITNVFQRETVKNKIKKTLTEKYGNGNDIENISQTQLWKGAIAFRYIEKYGIDAYIDKYLENSSERNIYYKNVWSITISQLKQFGKEYLGYSFDDIKEYNKQQNKMTDYLTIDHKFSIIRGFTQKVHPEIIGSINNLDIIPFSDNCAKNSKCSITLTELKRKCKKYKLCSI